MSCTLLDLVDAVRPGAADRLAPVVEIHPDLDGSHEPVPRRVLAQALALALFDELCDRVASAAAYVADQLAAGRRVVLDHGAIRTVAWPNASALPAGEEQVTRILRPLGYELRETYPLTRLRMTGRSYAHVDQPEHVSQWFVSELHPDEFSDVFQRAVTDVLSTSVDPIDDAAAARLERLATTHDVPYDDAVALLDVLVSCFARLHAAPLDVDYDTLVSESAEMAWIATEGTSFNHATDRVADVVAAAEAERAAGRPIKDTVEVSGSGRVRQTAHRAQTVERPFRTAEGDVVWRTVPGSFFELIARDRLDDGRLDLAFDAANATGIFAMTRADAPDQRE